METNLPARTSDGGIKLQQIVVVVTPAAPKEVNTKPAIFNRLAFFLMQYLEQIFLLIIALLEVYNASMSCLKTAVALMKFFLGCLSLCGPLKNSRVVCVLHEANIRIPLIF